MIPREYHGEPPPFRWPGDAQHVSGVWSVTHARSFGQATAAVQRANLRHYRRFV